MENWLCAFCLASGLEWDSSGTRVGLVCDSSETRVGLEWDQSGTREELERGLKWD